MSNIQDAINDINYNYNFPALNKLIKLVQSKYTFSRDDIIKTVKGDINNQLMQGRRIPKATGHITSLAVNELMQLDIFDMQRYKEDNIEGSITYPYMLVLIDVFSRYAYVEPLQDKSQEVVLDTFKKLVDKVMQKQTPTERLKEKTKSHSIHLILSDNEGSFQSNIFEKYLDDNSMVLNMNAKHDHRALGIIDNFAKRIKTILTKTFLLTKNYRWLNKIDKIIDIYNNTAHIALDGLTPQQALNPQNFNKIVRINMQKKEQTKRSSDLKIGDKVRKYILLRKEITKPSMEPNWSETIYKVVKTQGTTITLEDGTKFKRYNLFKIPNDT